MSSIANNLDSLKELFFDLEDLFLEKSSLHDVVGESYISVQFNLEEYDDEGTSKYKCVIVLTVDSNADVDEDTMEEVSDVVQDFCRGRGDLDASLERIGVDPEAVDWWPVEIERESDEDSDDEVQAGEASTKQTRQRIRFTNVASKLEQMRQDGLNELGIKAYEHLFGILEKKTTENPNFRISFAGRATTFNDDNREGKKILLYVYNPSKSKGGLKIDIKPWVCDLNSFRSKLIDLAGPQSEQFLRIVEDSAPCLRLDTGLASATDADSFWKILNSVANIVTDGVE